MFNPFAELPNQPVAMALANVSLTQVLRDAAAMST